MHCRICRSSQNNIIVSNFTSICTALILHLQESVHFVRPNVRSLLAFYVHVSIRKQVTGKVKLDYVFILSNRNSFRFEQDKQFPWKNLGDGGKVATTPRKYILATLKHNFCVATIGN